MAILRIVDNINSANKHSKTSSDIIELKNTIRMLISNEHSCRVSIAGDGAAGTPDNPVEFIKSDHDELNADEGINISFYLANAEGNSRTEKVLNGSDNIGGEDKSRFGQVRIKSIKLYFPNDPGRDYPEADGQEDIGLVRLVVDRTPNGSSENLINLDFDLSVYLSANNGTSMIVSCSSVSQGGLSSKLKKVGYYFYKNLSDDTQDGLIDIQLKCPAETFAISHGGKIAASNGVNCYGNSYEGLVRDPFSGAERDEFEEFDLVSGQGQGKSGMLLTSVVGTGYHFKYDGGTIKSVCGFVKLVCMDPMGLFENSATFRASCSQDCGNSIEQPLTNEQLKW